MQKYFTPKFIIPGVCAAVVGLAALWYLVSPLFINVAVSEAPPSIIVIVPATATTPPANAVTLPALATAAMQQAMSEPPKQMADAMPVAVSAGSPQMVASGAFYNVVHEGKGNATIFKLASDAKYVLRLEDFQVLNGPDLHVWLVPVDPVPNSVGTEIAGYVDLGKLKGNIGNQNYELPANLDLKGIKSVVIWCQPFRVPFIAAPLMRSAGG